MLPSSLKVQINKSTFSNNQWLVDYSLTSLSSTSLFIIQDKCLPFLRARSDKIQIWLGIPPQTEIEKNRRINALILPDTIELLPKTTIKKTITVNFPFKESGYWLEEDEETKIKLVNKKNIKAQLIQGFGTEKIDHQKVRNIHELYTWQSTIRSQIIELELPKQET